MNHRFTAALFVTTLLCSPIAVMAQAPSAAITAAVADAGRPAADKAADTNRKPGQVLAFAGVKPGMVVAELGSGGGCWSTRVCHQQNSLELPPMRNTPCGLSARKMATNSLLSAAKKVGSASCTVS